MHSIMNYNAINNIKCGTTHINLSNEQVFKKHDTRTINICAICEVHSESRMFLRWVCVLQNRTNSAQNVYRRKYCAWVFIFEQEKLSRSFHYSTVAGHE